MEKYRIDFLSFKSSLPNTKIKSLCPMCEEVPNIHLSTDSEKGHYVKCNACRYCYCCSHPRTETLDDYISVMVKIQQENIKCDVHKEKGIEEEGYFSCEYCQKWMCEECINKHIKEKKEHYYYIIRKVAKYDLHTHCLRHNLEEYSYYLTEDFMIGYHLCKFCNFDDDDPDTDIVRIPIEKGACFLNQLKEILKNGVEYLDNYCQNIYNHLINSIKNNPDLLKKAKEIYEKFLIRNRRVLFYYQMCINAGTPSIANYNLIKNISSLLFTKFEKINISLTKELNKEDINKILNFFDKNYIVGFEERKMEETNEFNIKEICTIKREIKESDEITKIKEEKEKEKDEDNKDDDKKKIKYMGIILLNESIICTGTEDGFIHLFDFDKTTLESKNTLAQKVHEKRVISLDNIKNTKHKFVTCDEKSIKIWKLNKTNNNYTLGCDTVLKNLSKYELKNLYVLNNSDKISFSDDNNELFILDSFYKKVFNINTGGDRIKGLYQIESNDENNDICILGKRENIYLMNPSSINKKDLLIGTINCGCFCGNSFYYLGKNKLIVGDEDIYIVDIKSLKLENIIKIGSAEITCFLKFNDLIICGYGDTRGCSSWSYGIANEKTTKFCALKINKEKYESILLSDDFNECGITNALWIDKDKFISCFYEDDKLKVFQIK